VSEIDQSNIHRGGVGLCVQPFRSITVPQREQVRRARFE
jgi:hypothetical protein